MEKRFGLSILIFSRFLFLFFSFLFLFPYQTLKWFRNFLFQVPRWFQISGFFFFPVLWCSHNGWLDWLAGWLAGNHPPEEFSQIPQQAKEEIFLNKIEKNKNSCTYILTTSWNLFLYMAISEIICSEFDDFGVYFSQESSLMTHTGNFLLLNGKNKATKNLDSNVRIIGLLTSNSNA